MKVLVLTAILALTACNQPVKFNDVSSDVADSFKKAGDDINQAGVVASRDTTNFFHTAGDDINAAGDKASEDTTNTLNKAGDDTARTFETAGDDINSAGVTASRDTTNELNRTGDRIDGTLVKTNSDVTAEEHKFNQRTKDTAFKANEDFNHEQARATDKLVGSDQKTIDQHGDDIRDLQRRMALVEQVNVAQSQLLDIQSSRLDQIDLTIAKLREDLTETQTELKNDVESLSGVDADLQNQITLNLSTLLASIDQEKADRIEADADNLEQLAIEIENRENADDVLRHKIAKVRTSLKHLKDRFNSFKYAQQWNNYVQQHQISRLFNKVSILKSRMTTAESDINSLQSAVLDLETRMDHLDDEAVISSILDQLDVLNDLTVKPCTLTATGPVTAFSVAKCDSFFGTCGTETLKKQAYELKCLDQTSSVTLLSK